MFDNSAKDVAPKHQPTRATPEPLHWRWRLLFFVLWLGVALIPILWVHVWTDISMGNWSLGYWLLAQGTIIFFVLLTAAYAWAANKSERNKRQTPNQQFKNSPD